MVTNIELSDDTKKVINEHINALMEIAQIYQIPMFFTIVTGNSEASTEYNKGVLSAQSVGIKLKNDTVRKHLLVEAGYELIPPRENITVDMGVLMND